jgi:hypothetical protein
MVAQDITMANDDLQYQLVLSYLHFVRHAGRETQSALSAWVVLRSPWVGMSHGWRTNPEMSEIMVLLQIDARSYIT